MLAGLVIAIMMKVEMMGDPKAPHNVRLKQLKKIASTLKLLERNVQTMRPGPDGKLSAEDLGILRETFIEMDTDKSGSIDIDEFYNAMRKLGKRRISKKKAATMFHKVDVDDSGEIDFDEFVDAFTAGGAKVDEEDKEFDC